MNEHVICSTSPSVWVFLSKELWWRKTLLNIRSLYKCYLFKNNCLCYWMKRNTTLGVLVHCKHSTSQTTSFMKDNLLNFYKVTIILHHLCCHEAVSSHTHKKVTTKCAHLREANEQFYTKLSRDKLHASAFQSHQEVLIRAVRRNPASFLKFRLTAQWLLEVWELGYVQCLSDSV